MGSCLPHLVLVHQSHWSLPVVFSWPTNSPTPINYSFLNHAEVPFFLVIFLEFVGVIVILLHASLSFYYTCMANITWKMLHTSDSFSLS